MKVRFKHPDQEQEAVVENQREMKQARLKRFPVAKLVLFLLVVGLSLWGYNQLENGKIVYCYGIVQGEVDTSYALVTSTVTQLNVSKGSAVNQGDVLAILEPIISSFDIEEAKARLKIKQENHAKIELDITEASEKMSLGLPVYIQLEHKRELKELKALLAQSLLNVRNNELVLAAKEKHVTQIKKLFLLDAATKTQFESAEVQFKLAKNALLSSKIDLQSVEGKIKSSDSDYNSTKLIEREKSQKIIDNLRRKANELKQEIALAELKVLELTKLSQPEIIKATFTGIITDIRIAKGSVVKTGEEIFQTVKSDELRIGAYVPAERYTELKSDSKIVAYPAWTQEGISCKITENKNFEVEVPMILKRHYPKNTTLLYLNLKPNDTNTLAPGNVVRITIK